jgi:hypothetical protein
MIIYLTIQGTWVVELGFIHLREDEIQGPFHKYSMTQNPILKDSDHHGKQTISDHKFNRLYIEYQISC